MWDERSGRTKMLYEHHGEVALGKRNPFISDGDPTYVEKFEPIYNSSYQLEDDWYTRGGALTSSIHKRAEVEDHSILGDKAKVFTCNDGGQCKQGGCSGDSCEWKPPAGSKVRRADDDDEPSDADPVTPCANSIPAFMYNCKFFPDRDGGGGNVFEGICHNILNYFRDFEGGGSGPTTLTYNHAGTASGANRKGVCGAKRKFEWTNEQNKKEEIETTWSTSCIRLSDSYARTMNKPTSKSNGNGNWLSCDEFPFNA